MRMPTPAVNPDSLKTQLVEASRQLSMLIDPTWQQYLALPAEIYTPMEQPSAESLAATMTRFDRVAQDARYRALTQRGEFRSLHELLRKYQHTVLPPPASPASLPPPPVE